MADQQGNFLSKFVPRSHFFTDPDSITQTETQAFGPASTEEFRVTSSFNIAAANANAYAICKSIVLVQPQAGSTDKVNLVLRPYTQPIQGLNIKYFIYRGLKLSDFFSGTLVKAAGADSSDLVNSINNSFTSFHTSIGDGTVPDFLAKYIGFDPANQADTLPLSDFFFKQSDYVESNGEFEESGDTAFELPTIAMGATLGTFAAGECGIDVVLDYGDYKLPVPNDEFNFNLAYARAAKVSISTAAESDLFKKKVIREQIFQFLDVAAYFGFHAIDTGSVTLNSSGTPQVKKGQEIYDLMVSKFFTKNRLYLYIQSDRTRSYNFYENYNIAEDNDNSLKMGISESALTERKYETSGWPLIIDESSQSSGENYKNLFLQFLTDGSVNTALYGRVADISNAQSNNFCDRKYLKAQDNSDGTVSNLTTVITLSNPAVTDNSGNQTCISSFNILNYCGRKYEYVVGEISDDNDVKTDAIAESYFLNDIFDHPDATPLISTNDTQNLSTVVIQKVQLLAYDDIRRSGVSAIQTIIVNDRIFADDGVSIGRVTYISGAVDVLANAISASGGISLDTKSNLALSGLVENQPTFELPDPFYFEFSTFEDNEVTVNGVSINTTDGSVPVKLLIGISEGENAAIKTLIQSNAGLYNSRLVLIGNLDNPSYNLSGEVSYAKYALGVVSETASGKLSLSAPDQNIELYSIDGYTFFSNAYSKYMSEEESKIKADINSNI